ncbi:hypothetical protein ONZ45_g11591 [Pleurotus djamor]|nr:hypothetical protein ONZ45_g11591 [Pleurotus djamor]
MRLVYSTPFLFTTLFAFMGTCAGAPSANSRLYCASHARFSRKAINFKACPIYDRLGGSQDILRQAGYTCVDIMNDLESCGGCAEANLDGERSNDGGRDCTAIPHVGSVSCIRGQCIIASCVRGYELASDEDTCEEEVYYDPKPAHYDFLR